MASAILAVGAALGYGAADFLGGVAARRAPAVAVTALSQAAGLTVLLPALLVLPGEFSVRAVAIGGAAGLFGALGLTLYLMAFASGPMGVAAPLAAAVGAVLPVGAGLLLGERPSTMALVGVPVALLAVALTSWQGSARLRSPGARRATLLAVAGGASFGLFFVVLAATPPGSGAWPLLGARASSLLGLGSVLVFHGSGGRRIEGARRLAVAMGLADMAANVLFLTAVRLGRLSLTGLLASLYPVVVIVLAWLLLGERLTAQQRFGAATAVVAVALISGG